jgi:hypothetical protein
MHTDVHEDERLMRFTKIALGFPQAERVLLGLHASFTVKKKTFAYFVNDHHGDGIVGMWCKVLPGDNVALIASSPKRFICRPTWDRRDGWGFGCMARGLIGTRWRSLPGEAIS